MGSPPKNIIMPWTNFASAKFVSRSQLLFLFCSLLAEEELFVPLSVSMDRKWNKNYLTGFMLLLSMATEVTKNATKGERVRYC